MSEALYSSYFCWSCQKKTDFYNMLPIGEIYCLYCTGKPGGGIKHDSDKPDLSMVSLELVEAVARVRMFGAKKYSRDNWKKGFKVTRSLAASLRHIFAFLSGQTNDPESGESHLAHAVCCLEHAIYDMKHHPANDDRGTNEAAPK